MSVLSATSGTPVSREIQPFCRASAKHVWSELPDRIAVETSDPNQYIDTDHAKRKLSERNSVRKRFNAFFNGGLGGGGDILFNATFREARIRIHCVLKYRFSDVFFKNKIINK